MSVFLRTPECFDHVMFGVEHPPLGHDRCLGGFHQTGVIGGWDCSCPCHRYGGKPEEPRLGTCDWGQCDEPSVDSRWAEDLHGWLPVCQAHLDLGAVVSGCDGDNPDTQHPPGVGEHRGAIS